MDQLPKTDLKLPKDANLWRLQAEMGSMANLWRLQAEMGSMYRLPGKIRTAFSAIAMSMLPFLEYHFHQHYIGISKPRPLPAREDFGGGFDKEV
jgi:hypothetical protein